MNKYLIYYIIFLFLLNYTECARRLCRRKMYKMNKMKNIAKLEEAAVEIEEEIDACRLYDPGEADNHLPMQNCYYGASTKGKIINPFKDYKNQTQDIFKSACIKCALCLAVAQSMNEAFQDKNLYIECPVLGKHCVCKILEPVCTSGFKNYDLREVNEDILLTVSSRRANTCQPVSMDRGPRSRRILIECFHVFNFTFRLRETCRKYLDNMDCDLHEKLKPGSMNLVDYLCNGDGLFRDCRNINLKRVDIPDQESNLCVKCS